MPTIANNRTSSTIATLVISLGLALGACKKKEETVTPEPVVQTTPETEEPAEELEEPGREYPDPPPPGDPKPVNFPEIESFKVQNGLKVYVVENHEVPIVTARLVVRAGTMDHEHVAPFCAAMLGEGTKARTKAKLDEAIEFAGGSLGAGAGFHVSTVRSRVHKKNLKLALTLMADQVQNPVFPQEALDKQKKQAKTGLDAVKASPGYLASSLFDTVAYPDGHPYGAPPPTPAQIDAVKLDDIRAFHDTFYRPNNAFLILSGDITPQVAEPLVARSFGRWKSIDGAKLPPNPLNQFTKYELPGKLTVHLVDRPGSAQAEIRIGNLAIARNHEDWVKLQLANTILGDDASGRLFTNVREKYGLAYGIYSRVSEGQAPGTFTIQTRTRTKQTGDIVRAVFEHIQEMRTTDPTQKEFDTVQKKMIGTFPLDVETPSEIAAKVREILIYQLDSNYWKSYRDEVADVELDDVKEVARKYIHPIPHVVIVGKAKKIQPQLEKVFPKVTIIHYNTELERVEAPKKKKKKKK